MDFNGCPHCKNEMINYYDKRWRFECDDGFAGVEIDFCPFCGKELPKEVGNGS